MMTRAAIACLILLVGADPLHAQTQGPKLDDYPAVGAPPAVTLLSAGAVPRTALRYVVPATYKERLSMKMVMGMAMEMGGMSMPGMSMPAITMTADIAVTAVSPGGDITYTLAFSGATVDTAGADPTVVAALQGLDASMKASKGTATVSNRGVSRGFTFDLGTAANPQFAQMMNSASSTLQNLSMPLPEDEVGAGARWEVRQTLSSNGVKTFQKNTMELVAFDGRTATLKTTIEQTAPPQAISNPAMPAGADVQLERLSGTGTGAISLPLTGLVPTSDVTMTSDMVMSISMAGNQQTVTTKISIKAGIAPVK
jgi:hypothetical protein